MLNWLIVLICLFALQGLYRNWGKAKFDAMPPHIDEASEWNGKDDDDHWYTKWRKRVKGWFAFGPLSEYSWARFRNYPVTLIAARGPGKFRMEFDGGSYYEYENEADYKLWIGYLGIKSYLSRVQYATEWHVALEWPLFLHGHFGQWQFYVGFKRDADRIYWLSLYVGKTWK